ncbi:hypothetical protein Tco_0446938, partial [Tanacetum coccineum]
TQKYMLKGFPIFLAHVTTKETEDKSETKRLEDVPIVRDFREGLPEALFLTLGSSGLVCQEELWIVSNVYRLPRAEQDSGEESLSTPKDR